MCGTSFLNFSFRNVAIARMVRAELNFAPYCSGVECLCWSGGCKLVHKCLKSYIALKLVARMVGAIPGEVLPSIQI